MTHAPAPDFVLHSGDVLVVQARLDDLVANDIAPYFEVLPVGLWAEGALAEGVYLAPSPFEAGFISAAHGEAEIAATVEAAGRVFRAIARES